MNRLNMVTRLIKKEVLSSYQFEPVAPVAEGQGERERERERERENINVDLFGIEVHAPLWRMFALRGHGHY